MPWDVPYEDENIEADEYDDEWYEDCWIPYHSSRREDISRWLRDKGYGLLLRLSDPFFFLRQCTKCGSIGCLPRATECSACWLPF